MSRPRLAAWLLLVLVAAAAAPAAAYPRPGVTERVSLAFDGAQGDHNSLRPALSADGRFVSFYSAASNLVPGDTNGTHDVFVHDRESGSVERVSVASDGTQGNAGSWTPSISADGRYVAFVSHASSLVADDDNGARDIFVHDRDSGATERVSVATDGTEANGDSLSPSISADGRHVAFYSLASNLVAGDTNATWDVFVHDRDSGATERVSVAGDGTEANNESWWPVLSAEGRYVAFSSVASNLVAEDTNGTHDVFIHDRTTGATERVSVTSDGEEADDLSLMPAMSADGRQVAFYSLATNLVANDTRGMFDIYVHDRTTGVTQRVSVASDGVEADYDSRRPAISADGRYVAFDSLASNLVPGDTNGASDVFVHDRQTGVTERVSIASDGAQGNGFSGYPAITPDGRHVAFESRGTNLVPGDTNGREDVFVRNRGPDAGVGAVVAVAEGDTVKVSGWSTFSGHVIAAVDDPAGPGAPAAGAAGAELTAASLVHRPEQEDLLVRLRLASLPRPPAADLPAVLYGLQLHVDGTRYEVRALQSALTGDPPGEPHFGLYRCEPDCVEELSLSGGIGTTGPEVVVSVPLDPFDAAGGATVTGIQAFTAVGEAAFGALVPLHEIDLPDGVIPVPHVRLGMAHLEVEAALLEGYFSATLDTAELSAGAYELWARACLGEQCATERVSLSL